MGVDEEESNPLLAHQLVHAGNVSALAEPHPLRTSAEQALVYARGRVNLCAEGGPVPIEQGKERVRRRAGDDLQTTGVLQRSKAAHDVAFIPSPAVANLVEAMPVHLRELVKGAVFPPGAVDLLLRELDECVDLLRVSLLEQIVGHHRQERRAEAQGDTEIDVVAGEALEGQEEGRVGLRDRLEEPFLLHVRGGLGVTDERQVRVKDDGKIAVSHVTALPCRWDALPSVRAEAHRLVRRRPPRAGCSTRALRSRCLLPIRSPPSASARSRRRARWRRGR